MIRTLDAELRARMRSTESPMRTGGSHVLAVVRACTDDTYRPRADQRCTYVGTMRTCPALPSLSTVDRQRRPVPVTRYRPHCLATACVHPDGRAGEAIRVGVETVTVTVKRPVSMPSRPPIGQRLRACHGVRRSVRCRDPLNRHAFAVCDDYAIHDVTLPAGTVPAFHTEYTVRVQ